jgi:hypothetical protein
MHCILYSPYLLVPAYEFPNYIATEKTQLIINSSTDIRSDLVLFNYFLISQQIPIASVILLLLQRTHPISCLIFLLKRDNPIYLLIPLLTYSMLDLIAFLSFLVTQ